MPSALTSSTCEPFVWEAGHGEQMLNAEVHAKALPNLVRARASLKLADVRWLAGFEHTEASRRESSDLRERCGALATSGLASVLKAQPEVVDVELRHEE